MGTHLLMRLLFMALGGMLMVPNGIFSMVVWVLDLRLWFSCDKMYQIFSKSLPGICLLYFSAIMGVEIVNDKGFLQVEISYPYPYP